MALSRQHSQDQMWMFMPKSTQYAFTDANTLTHIENRNQTNTVSKKQKQKKVSLWNALLTRYIVHDYHGFLEGSRTPNEDGAIIYDTMQALCLSTQLQNCGLWKIKTMKFSNQHSFPFSAFTNFLFQFYHFNEELFVLMVVSMGHIGSHVDI